MKKIWLISATIILILAILLIQTNLTGFNALFLLSDSGNKITYEIDNARSFVQCFDTDPDDSVFVKGMCHAQFYCGANCRLVGMEGLDYCVTKKEVADYFCAKDLSCQKTVSLCRDGFECISGICTRKGGLLKLPDFSFNL